MQSQKSNSQAVISPITFRLADENRLALLKNISKEVNKKSFKLPRKSCKHCYGRGFIGYLNGIKKLPVPCRCTFVKPNIGKRR